MKAKLWMGVLLGSGVLWAWGQQVNPPARDVDMAALVRSPTVQQKMQAARAAAEAHQRAQERLPGWQALEQEAQQLRARLMEVEKQRQALLEKHKALLAAEEQALLAAQKDLREALALPAPLPPANAK